MTSQPLTNIHQPQSLEEKLTTKHLAYLVETLYEVAEKCQAIGLQLGVDKGTLRKIEKEHKGIRYDEQLCEILDTLLRQAPLTMQNIVQVLEKKSVGEKKLASQIACQFTHSCSVASSKQVEGANVAATPPSTDHSVFQPVLQPNITTPKAQPHSPAWGDKQTSHVPICVGNMHSKPSQSPQHSSPSPSPTPSKSTPSQPQAETTQTPSIFQPSSSQLMSVSVTGKAMPGPSPQLSQDMATPHTLQVGEQWAHQRQPPLQHIQSHESQTMAQSHGIGSRTDRVQLRRKHRSPMAQYIEYVKTLYRKTEIEKKLSTIKWPPTPSTVYINLVCVDQTTHISKKEADECTRVMVEGGIGDVILKRKSPIDFSDIARNVSDSETIILVEGAPGVGKSTFAWEFCRRWERGETAEMYQLVLLLRLRDERINKAQNLADLIYHPSDHIRQAVVQELESTQGMNTLIILEGFDELSSKCRAQSSIFMLLVLGELLPDATVLVTSRPWATQIIHKECSDRIYQHIEILGFTSDQIEGYVQSVFMEKKGLAEDETKKNIAELMSYIKMYPQIKACMYIPLNSAIVVCVYQESKAGKCILPRTLTQLYFALTQILLLRYLHGHPEYGHKNWKIESLKEDLPPDVYRKLLVISELAYSGMISTDQNDSVQIIFSKLAPDFETLGLMQSVPQLYATQGEVMSHNFLHLTYQEFLAAMHISNMSQHEQLKHFQRKENGGRWMVVLRFLAGITKLANYSPDDLKRLLLFPVYKGAMMFRRIGVVEMGSSMRNHISSVSTKEVLSSDNASGINSITADAVLFSHYVNLIFETQRDDIIPLVLKEQIVEFKGDWRMPLLDFYSLGYCIAHSHSQWVLTIGGDIEEEEVRTFVAGVKTIHGTRARVMVMRGEQGTMYESTCGNYHPLSISTEALNLLFTGLQGVIYLHELRLVLPVECSSITWPDLSGLQVLHLRISGERNWRLDTLLPHLSLEALTIEVFRDEREKNWGHLLLQSTKHERSLKSNDVESIEMFLSSSKCPKRVQITDKQCCITAEVVVDQHVQLEERSSSVQENESGEFIRCCLDGYSLGYIIAHSHFQWALTIEEQKNVVTVWSRNNCDTVEADARMLVTGVHTKPDTSAKVVRLKNGQKRDLFCRLQSVDSKALNVLFTNLQNVLYLKELQLDLPVKCSSITWPNLSGLRVLHLVLSDDRNWTLDTLLPYLSLETLTIEVIGWQSGLGNKDVESIAMLFSSSKCPRHVDIKDKRCPITAEVVGQNAYEKHMQNDSSESVQDNKSGEFISCRLHGYALGYVIAHSYFQWALTIAQQTNQWRVSEVEEINNLVGGASTKLDTSARVVVLKSFILNRTFRLAEALSVVFTVLKNLIYLHELCLALPVECCSIEWPELSGLRVLHLVIRDNRNWKLDTLLPHLSLESLTIEVMGDEDGLGCKDVESIGILLLSSNCPKHVEIKDKRCPITAEVVVDQYAEEKQNRAFSVQKNKSVVSIKCQLDSYSLGYIIVHSHFQWVLKVEQQRGGLQKEEVMIEEESVRMLVEGARTRMKTCARVVGFRGSQKSSVWGGGYCPLLISAEGLHMLLTGLQNVIYLQELHLYLPVECYNIPWLNLSGLQILHLKVDGNRNWSLGTLLPLLSLVLLELKVSERDDSTLLFQDCVEIGTLLSSSKCLKYLHFPYSHSASPTIIDIQGMESITKAMSDNMSLPLRSLRVQCSCTFSDTAAHFLALFITRSTTLHHLSIASCTFSTHGLLEIGQAIQQNSSLQEIKLQSLKCVADGDVGASTFVELSVKCPHMWDCLICLMLSHIRDRGTQAVATALSHMSSLMELYLSNSSLSDAGLHALAQAIHHNSSLRRLYLSENTISHTGLPTLTESLCHNSILKKVNLCNNSISDSGSVALAHIISHNSTLSELDLSTNTISDTGSAVLAQALHHNSTLWKLNLSNNNISHTGSDALAQALQHNSTLTGLNLSNNSISDHGSAAIAEALQHNSTLTLLKLSNNRISATGSVALARMLHHNSTLQSLDLSNNRISDTGSATLAQALQCNSTLRWLYLSNNIIGDTGSAALAQALHHNSTLQSLDLSNNSISDTGSAAIAQTLQSNSTLRQLNLSNNSISDSGSAALAQAPFFKSSFWIMDLSGNDAISAEGTHKLVQAATENTYTILFYSQHAHVVLPRKCEKFATQCPQYNTVRDRIIRFR